MTTTTRDPAPLQSRSLRALLWWADALATCVLCLTAGTWTLLTGQPLALTLALYSIVVVCGSYSIRSRKEFRRGWRIGYESATWSTIVLSAGRDSDVAARSNVHCQPTPEPWDEHVPPAIPRRVS